MNSKLSDDQFNLLVHIKETTRRIRDEAYLKGVQNGKVSICEAIQEILKTDSKNADLALNKILILCIDTLNGIHQEPNREV